MDTEKVNDHKIIKLEGVAVQETSEHSSKVREAKSNLVADDKSCDIYIIRNKFHQETDDKSKNFREIRHKSNAHTADEPNYGTPVHTCPISDVSINNTSNICNFNTLTHSSASDLSASLTSGSFKSSGANTYSQKSNELTSNSFSSDQMIRSNTGDNSYFALPGSVSNTSNVNDGKPTLSVDPLSGQEVGPMRSIDPLAAQKVGSQERVTNLSNSIQSIYVPGFDGYVETSSSAQQSPQAARLQKLASNLSKTDSATNLLLKNESDQSFQSISDQVNSTLESERLQESINTPRVVQASWEEADAPIEIRHMKEDEEWDTSTVIHADEEDCEVGDTPTSGGVPGLFAHIPTVTENGEEGEEARTSSKASVGEWGDGQETVSGTVGGPFLLYSVDESPPWYFSLVLAFQHFLTMLGACLSIPLVLAPALCIVDNTLASAKILGTLFVACGLTTFAQTTLGIRLPVVEGGSFAHLVPALAILSLEQWQCTAQGDRSANNSTLTVTLSPCDITPGNCVTDDGSTVTIDFRIGQDLAGGKTATLTWEDRMRELQGAIILSSIFEICIGLFGLVGVLLRFIGPLSIAPTVALVGISLFETASSYCSSNWWIAFLTMALIAIFSQYLRNVNVPCIGYKEGRLNRISFKLFSLFPVVLSITIAWLVCLVLTVTNAIPNDKSHWAYKTRTDIQNKVLIESKWFDVPYPFQWGSPTFSTASVFGMFSGILAAIVESIGGYYACARMSGSPSPPTHAINRGIFVEGIGNVISGMLGSGTGLTVYAENAAAIGITQVASRRVIQFTALLLIVFGVLGKVAALFVAIPPPVVGGVFLIMFGVITAVGISNLQFVDLNSTRNLFVFGVPLLLGLSLPQWLKAHPRVINTGVTFLDQMATVLTKTPMFVGGSVAIILDNTIPGTDEERGLLVWIISQNNKTPGSPASASSRSAYSLYDLPLFSGWFRKHSSWFRYIPVCPSFKGYNFLLTLLRRCTKKMTTLNPLRRSQPAAGQSSQRQFYRRTGSANGGVTNSEFVSESYESAKSGVVNGGYVLGSYESANGGVTNGGFVNPNQDSTGKDTLQYNELLTAAFTPEGDLRDPTIVNGNRQLNGLGIDRSNEEVISICVVNVDRIAEEGETADLELTDIKTSEAAERIRTNLDIAAGYLSNVNNNVDVYM